MLATAPAGASGSYGLAIGGGLVFWTVGEVGGGPGATGLVMVAPVGGVEDGGTPTTVAADQAYPWGLAVNTTSVYWADYDSATLMADPLAGGIDGGATELEAPGAWWPISVAVDSSNIYWLAYGDNIECGVLTTSLAGGHPSLLATVSGGGCGGMAIDATSVYFAGDGAYDDGSGTLVREALAGGGTPVTLATSPVTASSTGGFDGVAVDDVSVYATDTHGPIIKIPLAGGVVTTLWVASSPSSIAVDATSVYWIDGNDVVKLTPK
jgi:hypothetical protein